MAAAKVWQHLATDITHVKSRPFLLVIDTDSGFTMWWALRNESAQEMCHHLWQIFSEFGPPESLMSDNGTIFCSHLLEILLQEWEVNHELPCAYRSQGNRIIEHVHRMVKRTVKWANCTVAEAVFWVNNTCGEHAKSPFELVFAAQPRKPGMSVARTEVHQSPPTEQPDLFQNYADCTRNPFVVGDSVRYICDDPVANVTKNGVGRIASPCYSSVCLLSWMMTILPATCLTCGRYPDLATLRKQLPATARMRMTRATWRLMVMLRANCVAVPRLGVHLVGGKTLL